MNKTKHMRLPKTTSIIEIAGHDKRKGSKTNRWLFPKWCRIFCV